MSTALLTAFSSGQLILVCYTEKAINQVHFRLLNTRTEAVPAVHLSVILCMTTQHVFGIDTLSFVNNCSHDSEL